jgi:hypothetical protein
MKRIWKDIEGFEGRYQVSNFGEVKTLERLEECNGGIRRRHERLLKQNFSNNKHCMVVLCKDGKTYPKLVHRLVALTFIPNPENKPVVDHIDTNPHNNRVDNLRWVTTQENCMNPLTRKNNSESKKGHPYHGRPLTEEEIDKIRNALVGRKLSEEHKQKLSKAHKDSQIAMETTLENLKKAHETNTGRSRPDETRNKISKKMTGVFKGKHWKIVDGKRVWY